MIKLIYGDPGTGKTQSILSMLREDAAAGVRSFLIVPDQMTVDAERRALEFLPPSAQLYFETLGFSRLANRFFREKGGLVYNYADEAVKLITMQRAVSSCAASLTEYRRAVSDRSFPASLLKIRSELSACGVGCTDLDTVCDSVKDTPLGRKLREISLLISVYDSLLAENYSDSTEDIRRMTKALPDSGFLSGKHIYIDSFQSFTGSELALISVIFKEAAQTVVTVPMPSPLFRGTDTESQRRMSKKLRICAADAGKKAEIIICDTPYRYRSPFIAYLSSSLWRGDSGDGVPDFDISDAKESVSVYAARDEYAESEIVASVIRSLTDGGMRARDIAVIPRDAERYRGILVPELEKAGIPCFFSEKTPLSSAPGARLILSAFRIFLSGWRRDDVIAHIKTGLTCASQDDCDLFELYTEKWRITGSGFTRDGDWDMNPDGYVAELSFRGQKMLRAANRVKSRVLEPLRELQKSIDAAPDTDGVCRILYEYLLAAYKAPALPETDDGTEFDLLVTALEDVAGAYKGSPAKPSLKQLANSVAAAFDVTVSGSIPPSSDAVTVGSAAMIRADNAKCVIIPGMYDGVFPAAPGGNGLLTEADRSLLNQNKIALSSDRETKASDELFFVRRAISFASEKLVIITRGEKSPSMVCDRIIAMSGNTLQVLPPPEVYDRILSPGHAQEYASLLEGTAEGRVIQLALERLPDAGRSSLPRAGTGSLDASRDMIDPEVISAFTGPSLSLTQSKIEKFRGCPFGYTCSYTLRLDEGRRAEFSGSDYGSFVHYVLEKFISQCYTVPGNGIPAPEERKKIIGDIGRDYIKSVTRDGSTADARLLHTVDRLGRLANIIVNDILNEFSDSDFRPVSFELSVGNGGIPPLEVCCADGTRVTVSGKIDRVDVFVKNGVAYIRTVDYKTGSKTFTLDGVSKGENLQLLLYLFALTNAPSFAASLGCSSAEPAGISYLSSKIERLDLPRTADGDSIAAAASEKLSRSGLILDDEGVINAVSHSGSNRYLMKKARTDSYITREGFDGLYTQLQGILSGLSGEMRSGMAAAAPAKDACKYCRFGSICRSSLKEKKGGR